MKYTITKTGTSVCAGLGDCIYDTGGTTENLVSFCMMPNIQGK